jgi:hypothetical protein
MQLSLWQPTCTLETAFTTLSGSILKRTSRKTLKQTMKRKKRKNSQSMKALMMTKIKTRK